MIEGSAISGAKARDVKTRGIALCESEVALAIGLPKTNVSETRNAIRLIKDYYQNKASKIFSVVRLIIV
jgi:hypothetical protein